MTSNSPSLRSVEALNNQKLKEKKMDREEFERTKKELIISALSNPSVRYLVLAELLIKERDRWIETEKKHQLERQKQRKQIQNKKKRSEEEKKFATTSLGDLLKEAGFKGSEK